MLALNKKGQRNQNMEDDGRPRFGIGHISITASNAGELANFYTAIGMRHVMNMRRMAIVELRGGTHIVIQRGESGISSLDLIVDDIDATREVLESVGAQPSAIRRGNPHDSFTAADPEGNQLTIHSNHAMGIV